MNYDLELNTTSIETNIGETLIEIELPGGARGIQGEKGDKGDTGATGPQGIPGEKGDSGVWVGEDTPTGDYNVWVDPEGTPGTIPTKTSDLTNDSGFITEEDIPEIPTKTSDLTNDSGFIDNTYHDNSKQDILVSGTNIKTINNESVLGNGNISVGVTDVKIGTNSVVTNGVALIMTSGTYTLSNPLVTRNQTMEYYTNEERVANVIYNPDGYGNQTVYEKTFRFSSSNLTNITIGSTQYSALEHNISNFWELVAVETASSLRIKPIKCNSQYLYFNPNDISTLEMYIVKIKYTKLSI